MDIFIGIDQSINSTGITIQKFENEKKTNEFFYIIKPNKLTKNEIKASEKINNFEYICYNKLEKADAKDNNEFELNKLQNNIEITDIIINLINIHVEKLDRLYVSMEGVSYQSHNTQSIVDLSGLSYLIRYRVYKYFLSHQDQMGCLKIFSPNEVKKFASGNGAACKEVMINLFKSMNKQFATLPKIDDLSDSFWICCYMRKIFLDEYKY